MAPKRSNSTQLESPLSKRREFRDASPAACHWSRKDQILLEATGTGEQALWRRSFEIFGVPPHELLPANEHVNIEKNGLISHPGFPDGIKNTNWGSEVCKVLTTLILSSEFTGRPQYLRECIHHAICYRQGLPAPVLTLDDGADGNPHIEFLKYVKDRIDATRKTDNGDGVVVRDLISIRDGWDKYVDDAEDPTLEKMKTSQKKHREKNRRLEQGSDRMLLKEILRKKKQWILSSRGVEIPEHDEELFGDEFEAEVIALDERRKQKSAPKKRIASIKNRSRHPVGFSSDEIESNLDSDLETVEDTPDDYLKGTRKRVKDNISMSRKVRTLDEKQCLGPSKEMADDSDSHVKMSRDGRKRDILVIDSSEEDSSEQEEQTRVFEGRKLRKRSAAAFSYHENETEHHSEPEIESNSRKAVLERGYEHPHSKEERLQEKGQSDRHSNNGSVSQEPNTQLQSSPAHTLVADDATGNAIWKSMAEHEKAENRTLSRKIGRLEERLEHVTQSHKNTRRELEKALLREKLQQIKIEELEDRLRDGGRL